MGSSSSSVLPGLSKVKMSPSHLAALLGVLGSELQLERRRLFLLGETCSSVAESRSGLESKMNNHILHHRSLNHQRNLDLNDSTFTVNQRI